MCAVNMSSTLKPIKPCCAHGLGLAVKRPWLALGGPTQEVLPLPCKGFVSGREGHLGSEQVFAS